MHEGIAKVIEIMGDKLAELEREVTLYKSLYEATEKQKIELEHKLAMMGAQSDED
jgi:hypothetical protein